MFVFFILTGRFRPLIFTLTTGCKTHFLWSKRGRLLGFVLLFTAISTHTHTRALVFATLWSSCLLIPRSSKGNISRSSGPESFCESWLKNRSRYTKIGQLANYWPFIPVVWAAFVVVSFCFLTNCLIKLQFCICFLMQAILLDSGLNCPSGGWWVVIGWFWCVFQAIEKIFFFKWCQCLSNIPVIYIFKKYKHIYVATVYCVLSSFNEFQKKEKFCTSRRTDTASSWQ